MNLIELTVNYYIVKNKVLSMTFESQIKEFSKSIATKKKRITTEETTKITLILPFLKILGYDTENPNELKAEYCADVGVKKSEKIDLALLMDDEVKILIECKSANTNLNQNHLNQLLRYYSVSNVKIAILTNGVIYRFYTDTDNPGKLDESPFLEIDLRNLSDKDIESLKLFARENFSEEVILKYVEELKYRMKIREVIISEIDFPSDEMVRIIAKKVFDGNLTKQKFKVFQKLVQEEIANVFENGFIKDSEIATIDEEWEGFYIVRAILSEVINPSRVAMRDRKSYCAILFDDNQNYTICRLHFNDLDNLVVSFFDSMKKDKNGSRIEENIAIDNVSDIYKYKDKLIETVKVYKRVKK